MATAVSKHLVVGVRKRQWRWRLWRPHDGGGAGHIGKDGGAAKCGSDIRGRG